MTWLSDQDKLKQIWTDLQELMWAQRMFDDVEEALVVRGRKKLAISDEQFHVLRKSLQSNIISSLARVLETSDSVNLNRLANAGNISLPPYFHRKLKGIRKQHLSTTKIWRDKVISHTDKLLDPVTVMNSVAVSRQSLEDLCNDTFDIFNELAKLNNVSPIFEPVKRKRGLSEVIFMDV